MTGQGLTEEAKQQESKITQSSSGIAKQCPSKKTAIGRPFLYLQSCLGRRDESGKAWIQHLKSLKVKVVTSINVKRNLNRGKKTKKIICAFLWASRSVSESDAVSRVTLGLLDSFLSLKGNDLLPPSPPMMAHLLSLGTQSKRCRLDPQKCVRGRERLSSLEARAWGGERKSGKFCRFAVRTWVSDTNVCFNREMHSFDSPHLSQRYASPALAVRCK